MRISDWSSDVCSSDLYALDGSLKATPFIGGPGTSTCEGFDKAGHGLKPVRSAVWADAVFVDLSGQAPAFADFIAPIAQRWADFDFTRLRPGGADSSFSIEVGCNWKLAVETYCEAYHLPWIHPALTSRSEERSVGTEWVSKCRSWSSPDHSKKKIKRKKT